MRVSIGLKKSENRNMSTLIVIYNSKYFTLLNHEMLTLFFVPP